LEDFKVMNLSKHPPKLSKSSNSLPKDEDEGNLPPIDGAIKISLERSSKHSNDEQ
jgi:hypothetical protein